MESSDRLIRMFAKPELAKDAWPTSRTFFHKRTCLKASLEAVCAGGWIPRRAGTSGR